MSDDMTDNDAFLYEYAVVRYVPRVDREEFINVGLLMMCKRHKWLKGRIEICNERLLAFDPKADPDKLRLHASMFENPCLPAAVLPVEERYRWLAAVKSAIFQVSPSHPGIIFPDSNIADNVCDKTEILETEFNRLFNDLVG